MQYSIQHNSKISHSVILRLLPAIAIMCLIGLPVTASAQQQTTASAATPSFQYVNAQHLLLKGRGATIPATGYNRIDSNLLSQIPSRVAFLSKNTAGLQVDFITNSKTIAFKWSLEKYSVLSNMTPIAKSGLDLYGYHDHGFQFVAAVGATSEQNQKLAVSHLDGKSRRYRVYLPLYSSLTSLYIGVDSGCTITAPKMELQPKIVIYGTSITQGAAASRPGLAYPAILSRHLKADVYNMGFSGSGKMEPKMAEVIGHMPADLYILDCVPNMTGALIDQRAVNFVHLLRKLKPKTPILFVESIIRETSFWNMDIHKKMAAQNIAIRKAYLQLKKEGMSQIYYQQATDLTGHDHEATIDGTHLTDVGFSRLTTILEKKIREILPNLKKTAVVR